jgi:transcriptional repressor BetI
MERNPIRRAGADDDRRRQLIEATIDTMADLGFAATSLAHIARRAGVSPGLVAHYFDDKEGLLEATLRAMSARLTRASTRRLAAAQDPRGRIQAVIDSVLAPEEFDRRTCSVWLAFWGEVIHSRRLKRIQHVYEQRLLSNLRHALRRLMQPAQAASSALSIAALIDGLWLKATLSAPQGIDSATARGIVAAYTDSLIAAHAAPTQPSKQPMSQIPRIQNHIGGRPVAAQAPETFTTINPATGEVLAEIEIAGPAEVDQAVAAARAGQKRWAAMTGTERGRVLKRAADLLRARNDELARLETRDTGKPIQETSVVDVISGADCLEYFAGLAAGMTGEHVDLGPAGFGYTRREPLGIVAGIGAWNYPLQIACWKSAPALACGNAMIFKPAELNGTRVFVHRSLKAAFIEKLVARVEKMITGDPMDPRTQVGALISESHMNKVLGYIAQGKAGGAKLLTGGERVGTTGFFVRPAVFDDCRDDMTIVREEIFGPVMTILAFDDEDEVVARANDTEFGLAAGVFTRDLARGHRVVAALQAGTCWINHYNITPIELPFGGVKQSGLGRENSKAAIEHYTQLKSVYVALQPIDAPY